MESLQEFMNEETVKKKRQQKATAKQPAKTTVVYDQSKVEKAEQAIKGLKADLDKKKKAKAGQHEYKLIEDKIKAWEKKIADEKAKK